MSAKPYHRGHHNLVVTAAEECHCIELFVSTTTRENVSGDAMIRIWTIIEAILPHNVEVFYGESPVRKVWNRLGTAFENNENENFVIYGGHVPGCNDDITKHFGDKMLTKYVPGMFNAGQVKTRRIDRAQTDGISGTKMRMYMKTGDSEGFMAGLPKEMSKMQKQYVWFELTR